MIELQNHFATSSFNDRFHLSALAPELLGTLNGNKLGWPGEQIGVLPQDYFPGNSVPELPVFAESDLISQLINGFVHDSNDDGIYDAQNGDTIYLVDNSRITASRGANCDIQLAGNVFPQGFTVTASVFRLVIPGPEAVAVELKSWLEVPGAASISILNMGADGSLVLPANFDLDLGRIPLFTVTPDIAHGNYQWDCRLLDPVTGETRAVDSNMFIVR